MLASSSSSCRDWKLRWTWSWQVQDVFLERSSPWCVDQPLQLDEILQGHVHHRLAGNAFKSNSQEQQEEEIHGKKIKQGFLQFWMMMKPMVQGLLTPLTRESVSLMILMTLLTKFQGQILSGLINTTHNYFVILTQFCLQSSTSVDTCCQLWTLPLLLATDFCAAIVIDRVLLSIQI